MDMTVSEALDNLQQKSTDDVEDKGLPQLDRRITERRPEKASQDPLPRALLYTFRQLTQELLLRGLPQFNVHKELLISLGYFDKICNTGPMLSLTFIAELQTFSLPSSSEGGTLRAPKNELEDTFYWNHHTQNQPDPAVPQHDLPLPTGM
ncbi:hypothetical protein E4U61_003699 [Claviceps capensis]|nr:hypothetical protein E4U61_003699 [Claviceps capensis]